jgi:hypothetical protein
MSKATLILGAVTLTLGVASVYLYSESHTQRERAEALEARVQELEARPHAVTGPAPMPQLPPDAVQNPFAVSTAVPPAMRAPALDRPVDPAGPQMRANMQAAMDRSQKMLADPDYRAAVKSQQKFMLAQMYPDLAATLHLQPQEIDSLLEVLAEQQMKQMETRPRFRGDGIPDEDARRQMMEQMNQQQQQNQTEIAQLLGDAKLQEWKDYQSSLGARAQVRQFRASLESSGVPLRDDQVQPLVDAMMAEQKNSSRTNFTPFNVVRRGAGGGNGQDASDLATQYEESAQRMAQSNQRIRDTVSPHLSPRQMQAFDQMLNRQLEMQQIQARMMRAQAEAGARDGTNQTNQSQLLIGPTFVTSDAGVAIAVPPPGR